MISKHAKFLELYAKASKPENKPLPAYRDLLAEGMAMGLAYERKYKKEQVTVHEQNRDSQMCSSARMNQVGDDLDNTGIDYDLLKDATAIEESDNMQNALAYEKKRLLDTGLPKQDLDKIVIASVGCSHFRLLLCAMEQGMVPTANFTTPRKRSQAKRPNPCV